MSADAIQELLNRRPFEQFEMITSTGDRHVVEHPEFLMLLPSRAIIGDPSYKSCHHSLPDAYHRATTCRAAATSWQALRSRPA
jgi:hypothetical protein